MKESIFLTGGTGRIGRFVLKSLLERGYSVKALIHHHKPEGVINNKLELVYGDLLDKQELEKLVRGCKIICHLAAVFDMFGPEVIEKENDRLFEIIVRGTYNLLEAANKVKDLKLFLYASTDAVYSTGFKKFKTPVTEETEIFPSRFYALTKILGEIMCINYGRLYDIPWIILRISWTLAGMEVLKLFEYELWEKFLKPADRRKLGPKLANGKGVFAPLCANSESAVDHCADPEDIAEGIILAIEKHATIKNNLFNIAGPSSFRYLDVIERVAKGLGVEWDSARVDHIEPYEISIAKARNFLGYCPQFTIERMIDRAISIKKNK